MSSSDYQGRVNCFSTKVHLLARGSPLDLDLFRPLPLSVVLGGTEAQGLLLSSSDLTRVKLTRTDPKTGKTTEFIEDVASTQLPPKTSSRAMAM